MALVLADRVQDTTTTTGTGTVTLSGTAPTGYQNFSVVGNGNTTYYTIAAGAEWEVGIGTYATAGPTLARTTILASSNAGSAVNFSAGTKSVFSSLPAERAPVTTTAGATPTFDTTTLTGTTTASALVDISGASAGQIKFPASQNASANANTLDDYEEGTWTPDLNFDGAKVGMTYDARAGSYTKTGNGVIISYNMDLSALGSSTGSAYISALPFAAAALCGVALGYTHGTAGAVTYPCGYISAAATQVRLTYNAGGGNITNAELTNNFNNYNTFVYLT